MNKVRIDSKRVNTEVNLRKINNLVKRQNTQKVGQRFKNQTLKIIIIYITKIIIFD